MAFFKSPEEMYAARAKSFKAQGDSHWAQAKPGRAVSTTLKPATVMRPQLIMKPTQNGVMTPAPPSPRRKSKSN